MPPRRTQKWATSEAERLYRRLLSIEPRNSDAANGLGLVLAKQGRTERSAQAVRTGDRRPARRFFGYQQPGRAVRDLGQTNDAIACFQYGIRVAPDDEQLYLNLARIRIQMGDREKARELMQRLLARKPESTVAQRALTELERQ